MTDDDDRPVGVGGGVQGGMFGYNPFDHVRPPGAQTDAILSEVLREVRELRQQVASILEGVIALRLAQKQAMHDDFPNNATRYSR